MGSVVLEVGPSAEIHEFYFQAAKCSDTDCSMGTGVFFWLLGMAISDLERSDNCSTIVQESRFADIHEFCYHAGKRSDMVCVEVQGGLFTDSHEWHFQAAKRSD